MDIQAANTPAKAKAAASDKQDKSKVEDAREGAPAFAQLLQGLQPPAALEARAAAQDVLEARQALESSAAWLAAQRATAQDKARIQHCFEVMLDHQQNGHAELAARADAQFHLAIAEASHNLVLVQVTHSLFTTVLSTVARNRHDMFHLSAPVTVQALTEQHQALMQAILDGDPQRARQCIDEHLEHVRVTIQRLDEDRARQERSTRLPPDLVPPLLPETSPHT